MCCAAFCKRCALLHPVSFGFEMMPSPRPLEPPACPLYLHNSASGQGQLKPSSRCRTCSYNLALWPNSRSQDCHLSCQKGNDNQKQTKIPATTLSTQPCSYHHNTTTAHPHIALASRTAHPTVLTQLHSCCAASACSMLQRQQYTSFVVSSRRRSSSAKVAQKDSNPLKSFSTLLTSNVFANAASQVACRT